MYQQILKVTGLHKISQVIYETDKYTTTGHLHNIGTTKTHLEMINIYTTTYCTPHIVGQF